MNQTTTNKKEIKMYIKIEVFCVTSLRKATTELEKLHATHADISLRMLNNEAYNPKLKVGMILKLS